MLRPTSVPVSSLSPPPLVELAEPCGHVDADLVADVEEVDEEPVLADEALLAAPEVEAAHGDLLAGGAMPSQPSSLMVTCVSDWAILPPTVRSSASRRRALFVTVFPIAHRCDRLVGMLDWRARGITPEVMEVT